MMTYLSVSIDNLIDGIVYPEIRDRMILLKGEASVWLEKLG